MIAYVFWHHPRINVAVSDYEVALRLFHTTLLSARTKGLLRTVILRLAPVPWLSTATSIFEDWHLLESSATLDVLNQAAVSGACLLPHNRVAAMAGSGVAGLYTLRLGEPLTSPPRSTHWFSKPTGMSYQHFFDSIRPLCEEGCALWGRQMVLGPTPEFCLHSPELETPLPYPALACSPDAVFDQTP
jgi:hypothetical protein